MKTNIFHSYRVMKAGDRFTVIFNGRSTAFVVMAVELYPKEKNTYWIAQSL